VLKKLKNMFAYNKASYENMLDDPKSKAGVFFDAIILGLVISFPFVLIFESLGNNAYEYSTLLLYVDGIMSSIFAIEYFYRMYHAKSKISFAASPMRIIDLLSFAPFFL
jgi:voltage-gated potassium channel